MIGAALWYVTIFNILGAVTAFAVNVWAATNVGGRIRAMFRGIATLALLYVGAYTWLLFNPDRVEQWSDVIRPIGVASWVLAWCLEPIVITVDYRMKARRILEDSDRIIERHRV